jgi:putative N6-adenine-specific DNA methylase
MSFNLIATTLFGIESVTASEMQELGYSRDQIKVSDGQVLLNLSTYEEMREAAARLNIWLRTAERVLVELGSFPARDFDELFETSKKLPWEKWIEQGSAFHVNGYSRKSALFGIPACQRTIKKAIVQRLSSHYKLPAGARLPEDDNVGLLKIQFGIVSDTVTVMADTTGDGLHKRGYRPLRHEAPIRETLAAAMLYLSRFGLAGEQEALYDPFCGSGTIPIEGALIASNTAPGLKRRFSAENWFYIGAEVFDQERQAAEQKAVRSLPAKIKIFGSDIDNKAVELARENAVRAGVGGWIEFRQLDAVSVTREKLGEWTGAPWHLVVGNPPYGERLMDAQEAERLYRGVASWALDTNGNAAPGVRLSLITPETKFEEMAGGRADKRRKLYNGMIQCTMYHYFRQSRK